MTQWTVGEADRISFDETVTTLHVRIVEGAVNVVPTDGPARLEVAEIKGEPLLVTLEDGVLTVSYKDLSWSEFGDAVKTVHSAKAFFGSLRRKRRAVVSLAVPADALVKIGTVSADTTVSGIAGEVSVHGASGGTTLVGLSGQTQVHTVSGEVEAQELAGELRVNTVSGAVTLMAGSAPKIQAKSVSGAITLDLDVTTPTEITATTVSGGVGVRLPSLADAKVEAGTTTGDLTSTFEELTLASSWGAKRLSGQLGSGTGRLQVTTVTGPVTIQRRPDTEDDRPVRELPTTSLSKEL
ncbi:MULTISPECIES: DUF4097 family beta strand repeat-containing protein [Kitasatospora]|uniref:DUF4097 domain-containing protein n=2 Tax=Kitasatospora TaxID=2063 RepID=A0ABT1IQX3_9ACTN|nr:DUF4097 family beta strand repeat-containing protein [Kitasatospora paracochleata]MCP2307538.1 hypothetical protein [Kitasatospora paracochleata]